MAAESFSACSHSKSLVAIGDERTAVEVRRSRRPVCRADRGKNTVEYCVKDQTRLKNCVAVEEPEAGSP